MLSKSQGLLMILIKVLPISRC